MIYSMLHLVITITSGTIETNHFQYTPRLFEDGCANNRSYVRLITNENYVR